MRIAILTLSLHYNYGGILQAFALQNVLQQMGNEVYVLNKSRFRSVSWTKILMNFPLNIYKRYIRHENVFLLGAYSYNKFIKNKEIIAQNTFTFIKDNINSLNIESFTDIKESDFDAYVVGSDQVWRECYAKSMFGSLYNAFLDFTKDWKFTKKISYAASFGTSDWEFSDEETINCSKLLEKFNAVSTREADGVLLCSKYLNRKDAVHVLDPTLLLERSDYEKLFLDKTEKSEGNLLCYILDNNCSKKLLVADVSKQYGLLPFYVGTPTDDTSLPIEQRIQPPLEKWLRGFCDSEFVITDSFHACVFSIIFHKQFIVIANKKRGVSRLISLLSLFGLEDRLIYDNENLVFSKFNTIDYEKVDKKLKGYKEYSYKFLYDSLK